VPRDHVLVCEDGDVLELNDDELRAVGRVPAGYLYVDGIVGDVGQGVLRDRKVLAEEGVVVVVVTVDIETGKVLVGPEIITRGWVYAPEAEDLLDEACDRVAEAVEKALASVYAMSSRSSVMCAARRASSSTSAPSAGR
jgi:ribonuclease J